jgi:HAMP domain-containing protein
MSPGIQTAVALGIVVAAVAFFITRWLRGRKKPGCGGSCGCGKKL